LLTNWNWNVSAEFVNHIRRSLELHRLSDCTVVVAVSGGVDSISLLDAVVQLRSVLDLRIVVAHAHHALRGLEADDDQRFVVSIAEQFQLACETERLPVTEHAAERGLGIEAAARELRYAYLLRCAHRYGASAVLVGHTADDAAETLILHVARGSGIDGLASHRSHRQLDPNVLLLRPMLELQRADVQAYAQERELRWREDSTNADLHFLRNRVRAEVMPQLRGIFGSDVGLRMARTARLLRDARSIVRTALGAHARMVAQDTTNQLRIAIAPFRTLSQPEQSELVRLAIRRLSGIAASYVDTMRVLDLVDAEPGSMSTLSGHHEAWRERTEILLRAQQAEAPQATPLSADGTYVAGVQRLELRNHVAGDVRIDPDPNVAYLDAAVVTGAMVWRVWREGERFVPFGMQDSVLVADLLTNARIPSSMRMFARVVADDVGILWLCGIRQAERTRITASTQRITTLRLS
jgi:tRNA(Ile)-lysidine synthase